MFEFFKNKKRIPKSIGEIVTFQYTIQYIIPIANAVKLHETFIASEKQHTAIKTMHPNHQPGYRVIDDIADADFGKIYTFIEVGSCTRFFIYTV